MKLLSQISSKYRNTVYKKFWVVIPIRIIRKLGWEKGEELKAEIKNNELIITKFD